MLTALLDGCKIELQRTRAFSFDLILVDTQVPLVSP